MGATVTETVIRCGRIEPDREFLFFGHGSDNVQDRFEDLSNRERRGFILRELASPSGDFDHIAGNLAQAQRGAVDQPELAMLQLVEVSAGLTLEDLGQKEYRGERRTEIVGHLYHQFHPVRSGQLVGKLPGPIRLDGSCH